MSVMESTLVTAAARVGLFILTLSIILVIYRLVRGPKSADRIIALDLLSVLVVALVAIYAIISRTAVYLDVAIAYALVAFLGTVAFARYLERSVDCRKKNAATATKGDQHD